MTPKSVFFLVTDYFYATSWLNWLLTVTRIDVYFSWKKMFFFGFLEWSFSMEIGGTLGMAPWKHHFWYVPKFQHNQNETLFRAMLFCVSTQKCQQEVTPQKWLWRHRCTDVATLLKLRFWYNDMTTPCDFPLNANNMAWWLNSEHHK